LRSIFDFLKKGEVDDDQEDDEDEDVNDDQHDLQVLDD